MVGAVVVFLLALATICARTVSGQGVWSGFADAPGLLLDYSYVKCNMFILGIEDGDSKFVRLKVGREGGREGVLTSKV